MNIPSVPCKHLRNLILGNHHFKEASTLSYILDVQKIIASTKYLVKLILGLQTYTRKIILIILS
jgi:hypothetical protein